MPDFSEEKKLEISEKNTQKFSKVRVTSLLNGKNNEQGDHRDPSITREKVQDVHVQQGMLGHGGNHVVGSEENKWQFLNPHNLVGSTAHNGHGHGITAEL